MKTKRRFLIKQSLKKKIDTKWFKIVNVLIAIILVALVNLDKIVTFFGGDFDEATKIVLVDKENVATKFDTYFQTMQESFNSTKKFEVEKSDKTIEDLKKELDKDSKSILVEVVPNEEEYLKGSVITFDMIDTITFQLLSNTLNAVKSEYALAKAEIDPAILASVTSPMNVEQITTNPDLQENAMGRDIISMGVMMVFILPMFMLIILLVQMLGAEINDEKTTRSMEVIISNVSPKTHFLSKIFASTIFVLIQGGLLILYLLLGLGLRMILNGGLGIQEGTDLSNSIKDVIDMLRNTGVLSALAQAIPLILILLVSTLLAFALLAGVLASMTTSIEDFQQLQTPLMIICMAGYYIAIMASQFEGASFIKIFSYIPFFSAMISPSIYLLGQATLFDLGISCVLCILACFVLYRYGLRVYKVGILNYSSKDLWKKVFKSLKNKE